MLLRDQRMRVFHAVACRLNFTEAGRSLHLTQQAVSFHIRSLEHELKIPLFARNHNSIELTAAGSLLLAHASKILAVYDEAARSVAELLQPEAEGFRIAATNSISKYTLPRVISQFRQKYPAIQIVVETGNSARVIDYLDHGAVDVAITSDGAPSLSNYRVTPFFRDQVAFVTSPNHPWASRREISIEDLLATPLIMRETGSSTRALFERQLSLLGLSLNMLKIALVVGNPEVVKEAAHAGVGVGILSALCVRSDPMAGNLIQRKITGMEIVRDFHFVRPLNKPATPLLNEFMLIARKLVDSETT